MSNPKQINILLLLLICFSFSFVSGSPSLAQTKGETAKTIPNKITECKQQVNLTEVFQQMDKYINKDICFEGVFHSFSELALNYPKAERSSKDYISLVLYRPGTTIPLSELKLVYQIALAKKHQAINSLTQKDKVKIKGKMFSTALGEPWIDILEIEITDIDNSAAK